MAIDPRKESIFKAWFDYEHAIDEEAKLTARRNRNQLIQSLLDSSSVASDVTLFLRCFQKDYREWQVSEGLKIARKRF